MAATKVIDARKFVETYARVYRSGGTRLDLVEATGLSYGSVTARINVLKCKGVKLPKLQPAPRGRRHNVSVAELNKILNGAKRSKFLKCIY